MHFIPDIDAHENITAVKSGGHGDKAVENLPFHFTITASAMCGRKEN
jgi:hypothetical protein